MKGVKSILPVSLIFLLTISFAHQSVAQDTAKASKNNQLQKSVDEKKFVFTAQSVTPQRGGFRQLTSTYDVRVSGDSLVCNLPYFGRAYTAPVDPAKGGYNFTTTSIDYTAKPRKKGGYDVTIKAKDQLDSPQFFFNLFPNGSASLQVTSNSRQPISYNGRVR